MALTLAAVLSLAAACAPDLSPATMAAVAQVESGFDPLVIGVNGPRRRTLHPASRAEAATAASGLLQQGANIDLGLAQINAANLARLGLTVEQAFEPCANLRASAAVLRAGYVQAGGDAGGALAVLRTLSIYNTGGPERGLGNGYVPKVLDAAASITAPKDRRTAAAHDPVRPAQAPSWAVFASPSVASTSFVLSPNEPGAHP